MTEPTGAPPPRVEQKTSGLAIAALILSLIPVCLNFVGIVLGIVAAVKISKNRATMKGMWMAVLAIVIGAIWMPITILAAIAVPNFLMFQARSKQSEAKANLKGLYVAHQSYLLETGEPGTDFETIGFDPELGRRYTYHLGSGVIVSDREPQVPLPPDIEAWLGEGGFRAAAVANIDGDEMLDVWTISEDGYPENPYDDVHDIEQ